ncbi:MAG: hypothetical protein FWE98_04950 [Oscillospiraceae bacterium]|nr:hypothetical protein [Oscillospiraceae bacterium]
MKKVFALALALALALSMALMANAAVVDDMKAVLSELSGTVGVDEVKDGLTEALAGFGLSFADAADPDKIPEGADADIAAYLTEKWGLEGGIADTFQKAMSVDFIAWIVGWYTCIPEPTTIITGDNSTLIAIGAFAALSAAAAAAFVTLKKKEA